MSPEVIVVGTDGSADADRAVEWAAEQAAAERRPLVVLSATSQSPTPAAVGPTAAYAIPPEDLLARARSTAERGALLAGRHVPGVTVETRAVVGSAITELTRLTSVVHLVVLGSRGRGPARSKVLGSVSASVARHAACPVVICRPPRPDHVTHGILVGADGTEESLPVIEFAFRQASLRGQRLTVLRSVERAVATVRVAGGGGDPDLEAQRLLVGESVAGFGERFPDVRVRPFLVTDPPDEALATLAEEHELVVVGRHPAETLGRMVRSTTATAVLEHAHTNVAVVPEDRSPDGA